MIENTDLPMGFTMHLAQNQEAMAEFAAMTEARKKMVIEGARNVHSYNEMKSYVDNGFQLGSHAYVNEHPADVHPDTVSKGDTHAE